ncbi:MAG: nitrilase-related carbon-nitrogen hydrolase [Phycisphaerales bacterium]|jgi:N-carbamoylputrescine amidase
MNNFVRAGLIQTRCELSALEPIERLKSHLLDKCEQFVLKAADQGVQIVCLQELCNAPYFAAEQSLRWYDAGEPIKDGAGLGKTVSRFASIAKSRSIAIVIPIMERVMDGVYYNSAALIDEKGRLVGVYRKNHLPQCLPGFWEKFYFKPGDLGYPVFDLGFAKIGVYICYDRHFPEGARKLGLNGAQIVFNPSATVAGLSEYLWKIEQPAHAVANQYFVGAINRVGVEAPWNIGEFYGSSYFCDPRGQTIAQASRTNDELLIADLDLNQIEEVRRVWQFYRDRREETY